VIQLRWRCAGCDLLDPCRRVTFSASSTTLRNVIPDARQRRDMRDDVHTVEWRDHAQLHRCTCMQALVCRRGAESSPDQVCRIPLPSHCTIFPLIEGIPATLLCKQTSQQHGAAVCMHVPCSATVDAAAASKLRWTALVAQLSRYRPRLTPPASSCSGVGEHDRDPRPAVRMQQVCSAVAKCTRCIGVVMQL
jgi:hypothetical protein